MAGAEKVEFSGKVDLADYQEFSRYFDNGRGQPIYGATTWFITTSLKSFLEQLKTETTLREKVERAIAEMVSDNRDAA